MPKYRSSVTYETKKMAGARALWKATGMKDEDFGKIGRASCRERV